MLATVLVLVAAVLHAIWNTLIKFSGERLLVIACMDTVALVVVAAAVSYATECERDDETCALDLESARNGAMVGVFRCVRR